jgi:hypothetical protein
MDADDLYNYAFRMMTESFDKDPGVGNTDIPLLIRDIFIAENDDEDSVHEFIVGSSISNEDATQLINENS